jgi:hypothetical protein
VSVRHAAELFNALVDPTGTRRASVVSPSNDPFHGELLGGSIGNGMWALRPPESQSGVRAKNEGSRKVI